MNQGWGSEPRVGLRTKGGVVNQGWGSEPRVG